MHLLDINVLLALADASHVHHSRSRRWFLSKDVEAWATCPLTENGFVRILGQASYPGFEGEADEARRVLEVLVSYPGHQFWADELSILDTRRIPKLPGSKHLTDLYLLALAVKKRGRFATLDQRVDPQLIPDGPAACLVIPG